MKLMLLFQTKRFHPRASPKASVRAQKRGREKRDQTSRFGTAHSKMGGPTFVNEKVVHILEKKCSAEL